MKYEEAAKIWGAKKLSQDKVAYIEVTSVNFEVQTDVGCPTCGPETSYSADIWFTIPDKPKKDLYTVSFYGLDDILRELFEASEKL